MIITKLRINPLLDTSIRAIVHKQLVYGYLQINNNQMHTKSSDSPANFSIVHIEFVTCPTNVASNLKEGSCCG